MRVTVYREPCILLKATELVYAWVNRMPVENSALDKEFSVPVEEFLRLRDMVGQFSPRRIRKFSFSFVGYPLVENRDRSLV